MMLRVRLRVTVLLLALLLPLGLVAGCGDDDPEPVTVAYSTHNLANPFFAGSGPSPIYLAWCAAWVVGIVGLTIVSFRRREL